MGEFNSTPYVIMSTRTQRQLIHQTKEVKNVLLLSKENQVPTNLERNAIAIRKK